MLFVGACNDRLCARLIATPSSERYRGEHLEGELTPSDTSQTLTGID